jgi:hypothetical protein
VDPTTLAIGAAVGGGVGTLAALIVFALIGRFVYRSWQEFDALRTTALTELRTQNDELRKRIEALEAQGKSRARRGSVNAVQDYGS